MSVVTPTRLKSLKTDMIRRAVSRSRLAVGSSAIRIAGRLTIARAMASLCCSPPDSSIGDALSLADKPTFSSAARARARETLAAKPVTAKGSNTLSITLRSYNSRVSCKMTPTARLK